MQSWISCAVFGEDTQHTRTYAELSPGVALHVRRVKQNTIRVQLDAGSTELYHDRNDVPSNDLVVFMYVIVSVTRQDKTNFIQQKTNKYELGLYIRFSYHYHQTKIKIIIVKIIKQLNNNNISMNLHSKN